MLVDRRCPAGSLLAFEMAFTVNLKFLSWFPNLKDLYELVGTPVSERIGVWAVPTDASNSRIVMASSIGIKIVLPFWARILVPF